MALRAATFQIRISPSSVPDASSFPSGLKLTLLMALVPVCRTSPVGGWFARFQRRAVWSRLPEASHWPFGLTETVLTVPVWPLSGGGRGCLSPTSQIPILSELADANRCPSGLNARLHTGFV